MGFQKWKFGNHLIRNILWVCKARAKKYDFNVDRAKNFKKVERKNKFTHYDEAVFKEKLHSNFSALL